MPPIVFCTLPAVFSAVPSASVLASPVILPATSFNLPLAWWADPLMRSLSMMSSHFQKVLSKKKRSRRENVPSIPVVKTELMGCSVIGEISARIASICTPPNKRKGSRHGYLHERHQDIRRPVFAP